MAELEFTIPEITAVADIDMDDLSSRVIDEMDMDSLASLVSDEIDVSQQIKDELDECEFVIPEDLERIKREISDELVRNLIDEDGALATIVMAYVRDYVGKEFEAHHSQYSQMRYQIAKLMSQVRILEEKLANMLSLFAKVSQLHVGNSEDSSS